MKRVVLITLLLSLPLVCFAPWSAFCESQVRQDATLSTTWKKIGLNRKQTAWLNNYVENNLSDYIIDSFYGKKIKRIKTDIFSRYIFIYIPLILNMENIPERERMIISSPVSGITIVLDANAEKVYIFDSYNPRKFNLFLQENPIKLEKKEDVQRLWLLYANIYLQSFSKDVPSRYLNPNITQEDIKMFKINLGIMDAFESPTKKVKVEDSYCFVLDENNILQEIKYQQNKIE